MDKLMTIILISDPHAQHRSLSIPDADIVIHTGDACNGGNKEELADFFDWFSSLPAKYKIFVPGNHDLPFEFFPEEAKTQVPENIIVLENEGIEIMGKAFYSLPARPWLHAMPSLPEKVDVLLTHGAPLNILDNNGGGCSLLFDVVQKLKPKVHVFGHFHESAEKMQIENTLFVNTAACVEQILLKK